MGKVPYYTDSDDTEDTCSSTETVKNKTKRRFSILKYTSGNVKKKKCKVHSVSEPEESDYHPRSNHCVNKLRGILKHDREKESSEEEEDIDVPPARPRDQYLVGRVPRPAGRPGRGGGLAILIRKNADVAQSLQSQPSNSSTKRRRFSHKLARKLSY